MPASQAPLLFAVLLAACMAGEPARAADEGRFIRYRVEIDAPRELKGLIEERLPLLRWRSDAQMTDELLERLVSEAREQIAEAAATRGYFDARVEAEIAGNAAPAATERVVRIGIVPGRAARVAEVSLAFEGPVLEDTEATPLLERIRRAWRLRTGARFSQDEWNDAKRDAVDGLAGWRYASARVAASRASIDPGSGTARLSIEIDSGPAFRYGLPVVSGLGRYPVALVEGLNPAPAGTLHTREALSLYERRLMATGYFASAQASVVDDRARADRAPIEVRLVEARAQQAEAGLSFNTDAGPRVEGRYRNMNLFERARRLNTSLQLDRRLRQARADLDLPPRSGGRWPSVFTQALDRRIQNERNVELSAGTAWNWGLGEMPSAAYASAHAERQTIGSLPGEDRNAIFFGYRTGWRNTDRWDSPRRGVIVDLDAGGAPAALATRGFVRALVGTQFFLPVGADDLLLRARAGLVHAAARQGIPTSFLFRTGGDRTVRGYAFESLGLRQGDAVLGARRMAVASAEYTHWIGESWGLAGFVDAGNAWDGGAFRPAVGAGLGARVKTPIGPVRADLAYGFEEKAIRIHFSVGFGF